MKLKLSEIILIHGACASEELGTLDGAYWNSFLVQNEMLCEGRANAFGKQQKDNAKFQEYIAERNAVFAEHGTDDGNGILHISANDTVPNAELAAIERKYKKTIDELNEVLETEYEIELDTINVSRLPESVRRDYLRPIRRLIIKD